MDEENRQMPYKVHTTMTYDKERALRAELVAFCN